MRVLSLTSKIQIFEFFFEPLTICDDERDDVCVREIEIAMGESVGGCVCKEEDEKNHSNRYLLVIRLMLLLLLLLCVVCGK